VADLSPNQLDKLRDLTVAVGSLRDSALYAVLLIVAMLVGTTIVWLVVRYRTQKLADERLAREQAAKDARAKLYREDFARAFDGVSDALSMQTQMIQRLVDLQKGVISTPESLRIIEDHFVTTIIPEFCRVARQTIEKNDYHARKQFVAAKVRDALIKVVDKVARSLPERYSLSVKMHHFLPTVGASGSYKLVDDAWGVLQNIHQRKYVECADAGQESGPRRIAVEVHADHAQLQMKELCLQAYKHGADRALDIYREDDHTSTRQRVPDA